MSLDLDVSLRRRHFTVSVRVEFDGGTTGLYGPSGAGKSTLFNVVAGLERPDRGRVVLGGRVLTDTSAGVHVPPERRRIGLVFQERHLFPHLTVEQNLRFGERYAKEGRISFEEVAGWLDLRQFLASRPLRLSGGEQQRVAIGRALMTSPDLLLLDEPFTGVDVERRSTILPYLRRLRDELDIPLLVISHDLPDIQRLTDRVMLMREGACIGIGSPVDLLAGSPSFAAEPGLVNALRLFDPRPTGDGLFACRLRDAPATEILTAQAPDAEFTAIVRPNEIAISLARIESISIRNQVPGRVERVIELEGKTSCVVDIGGVRLIAEVTRAAMADLRIGVGDNVVCLFKSRALSS